MKRYRGGKRLRKSAARITAPKWTVIGLCPHHKSHDESCGWQPAKKGSSNAHVHDESSGYTALEVGTPSNVEDNAGGSAEAQVIILMLGRR